MPLVVFARSHVLVVGVVRVRVVRAGEGEDGVVVGEDVGLGDGELEVEDVEELTLDPADVALAKDPRAECPVDILEGGVVQVLGEGVSTDGG